MCLSFLESISVYPDATGIAHVIGIDADLERRVGDVLPIALDRNQMLADLARSERDAVVALGKTT